MWAWASQFAIVSSGIKTQRKKKCLLLHKYFLVEHEELKPLCGSNYHLIETICMSMHVRPTHTPALTNLWLFGCVRCMRVCRRQLKNKNKLDENGERWKCWKRGNKWLNGTKTNRGNSAYACHRLTNAKHIAAPELA